MDELWLLNVTNLRQTNQTNINDRNCLKAAITDKSRSKQAAKKTGKGDPQGDPLQNTGTSKIEEITETEPTEAGNSSISNRKSSSIFFRVLETTVHN